MNLVVVNGAGGFIDGQLVRNLNRQKVPVRGVDRKPLAHGFYHSAESENLVGDPEGQGFCLCCDTRCRDCLRRYRLFGRLPGRNKLKAGSRLLVSPFPEIKFICLVAGCCEACGQPPTFGQGGGNA